MNFKRLLFLVLVLITVLALVACGKDDDSNDNGGSTGDQNNDNVDNTTYYTVTYNYPGILQQKIAKDAKATAPTTPVKNGYTFTGWTLNGTAFSFDTSITGDITLEPTWEVTEYTITFMDGNTELTNLKTTYTIESDDIVLGAISKDHYNFMGWYKDSEFTENIQKVAKGTFGDITLYVQFTVKNYGITYVLDGGTNADGYPQSYNIKSDFPILIPDPGKVGYDFVGWFLDDEFAVPFTGIESVVGEVTVYAKWEEAEEVDPPVVDPDTPPTIEEREYKIVYMDGNTELELDPDKYVSGHPLAIPPIEKAHFVFDGWYTTATFEEGTKLENGITETTEGDLTLYAKFVPVTYNIKYYTNGGENNENNPATYTVLDKDFQFQNPTKEGYKFAGWFLDENYKVQVSTLRGRSGDITLYAKWEQESSGGITTPEDSFN